MWIRSHAEHKLRNDEHAENSHRKEQGIPANLHFAVHHLFSDPEQKQGGGARLHHEDRPWFHRTEGERSKQEQAEDAVQQNLLGLRRAFAAINGGNAGGDAGQCS